LKSDIATVAANITKIGAILDDSIRKIRQSPNMKKAEIDQLHKSISNQVKFHTELNGKGKSVALIGVGQPQ